MLLKLILVYYFCFVTANHDLDSYFGDLGANNAPAPQPVLLHRQQRDSSNNEEAHRKQFFTYTCEHMGNTKKTYFVVVLVYKSAGRYIGMGSIINTNIVLTASKVVTTWMKDPRKILAIAGRMGPWWGKGSQVQEALEIVQKNKSLALIKTARDFNFNKYVGPIKLLKQDVPSYLDAYGKDYVVFGIPRSSWDVPGDKTPKTARYIMQIETTREGKPDMPKCLTWFPDQDFSENLQICTTANYTFSWGCIGSPTVALTADQNIFQLGVVTKTADMHDRDQYHFHTKIAPFFVWLKSYSHLDY